MPPFIIEQIRKREERERVQPQLELPVHDPGPQTPPEEKRGVIIVDLGS